MNKLQLTLAIIKPHVLKNPVASTYLRNVVKDNFKIIKTKRIYLSNELGSQFYQEHWGKFFHNRLVTFMSSGYSDLHILAQVDAIFKWRRMLGPTRVYHAQYDSPESLRGMFGLSDTRNVAHGSDSELSAEREINMLFPEFSIESWYVSQEKYFRTEQTIFNEDSFQHCLARNRKN